MDSKLHLKYTGCQGWLQWSKVSYMNLPQLKNKINPFFSKVLIEYFQVETEQQRNCEDIFGCGLYHLMVNQI